MKSRLVLKVSLLVFAAAGLATVFMQEFRSADPPVIAAAKLTPGGAEAQPATTSDKREIVVYYFHTTVRCQTCRKIESLSKETIESRFAKELRDGSLIYRTINVQHEENRHFVNDYQLFTKSLVLVDRNGGRQVKWKNLEKVWDHVSDPAEFRAYVESEVREYLRRG
jgi:hypothetical protein